MKLEVICNNEFSDAPSYAKIELSHKLVDRILALNKAVTEIDAIKISDWCPPDEWLDYEEAVWDGRTECEMMNVYDTYVSWSAYIKNTSDLIEADTVTIDFIKEIHTVYHTNKKDLPLLIESLKNDESKGTLLKILNS